MKRWAIVALFTAVACAGPALARAGATAPSRGRELFELHCGSCHGLALQGSPDGPPLIGKSAADVDFMLRTGRMPAAVAWQQTAQGRPQFDDARTRALVAYVVTKGSGNPVLPALGPGDAARGRQTFSENCQACHGVTGRGASVGYGQWAPSLMSTAPEQIAEAARTGPGVMPAFGADVLTPAQLDDLVSYVELLQGSPKTENPGGLSLANVGPVAEGFVAWAFGIGGLMLLCRRIGSND